MKRAAKRSKGLETMATPSPALPGAPVVKLGRIGPLYLIGQLGWAIPAAASAVLMQALAAQIAPDDKIAFYTGVSVIGAVASTLATVLGGMLSDGTRSRLGKRIPWLIVAALIAIVALMGASSTTSRLLLPVAYGAFQVGVGLWVASLSALLPDRVAVGQMGRASAFGGIGYLIGQAIGGVAGGAFVTRPGFGLSVLPWTMAVAVILLALFLSGPDNRKRNGGERTPGIAFKGLIPPASADFWWAFAGRFLFILAVVMLSLFQLFALTDAVGLSTAEAGKVIGLSTLVFAACSAVGVIVSGAWSDRVGRKKPFVAVAAFMVAVGVAPLIFDTAVWSFFVFSAIGGIAFGIYIAVDQALMVAVLPNKDTAARDLGFLSVAQSTPIIIAPVIGGALASTFGYEAVFGASAVAAIAAGLCVFGIRRVR